jgi:Tol biopolymer transport system component
MTRPRLLLVAIAAAAVAAASVASVSHASFPGKNGPILFHYSGDIWRVAPAGGAPKRVTKYSEGDENSPSVSPDGKHLAVAYDPDGGTSEIYITDMKGKHPKWITKKLSQSGDFLSFENPTWTKDGKHLVFLCNSFSKHELCEIRTDRKKFHWVTHCGCVLTSPSAAPDVSKNDKVVWAYGDRLYTKPVKGGSPKVIATTEGSNDLNFQYPSWSPNGKQIAVQLNDVESAIDVMGAGGSGRHRILASADFSTDPTDYTSPAWSPDGKRIAVHVAGNGPSQGGKARGIYTVNLLGGDLRPVYVPSIYDFDQYLELDWARKPK